MQIDVLASSSLGNAYIVSDGETSILLDAGIPYKELQAKSDFKVNEVAACFISHEHGDHSKAVKDLIKGAIDVYALPETLSELGVLDHHRTHPVAPNETIDVKTFKIMPVMMHHDVPCIGYMVYSEKTNERLFFATDTYKITINPQSVDYLIFEINYQKEIVNELVNQGKMESSIRARLLFSHFELSKALKWLNRIDKSRLKRIYVAHLSGGHSNAEKIKNAVIAETGVPTTICDI
jgi:phosphoribosyl 1,2-cyclic phosphodiesterase